MKIFVYFYPRIHGFEVRKSSFEMSVTIRRTSAKAKHTFTDTLNYYTNSTFTIMVLTSLLKQPNT